MWVPKFFLSQVKIRIFAQKRPNLAWNWRFCSFWARPCRLIRCPVGGLVGGCGAQAVSRQTPIYFIVVVTQNRKWDLTEELMTNIILQSKKCYLGKTWRIRSVLLFHGGLVIDEFPCQLIKILNVMWIVSFLLFYIWSGINDRAMDTVYGKGLFEWGAFIMV